MGRQRPGPRRSSQSGRFATVAVAVAVAVAAADAIAEAHHEHRDAHDREQAQFDRHLTAAAAQSAEAARLADLACREHGKSDPMMRAQSLAPSFAKVSNASRSRSLTQTR
jgi:hypothetical protein